MPATEDDRGAKLISNPAEALNRLRSWRKGSFAETGYWIERRSVGRQENMLSAVTFRGALSSLPDHFFSVRWKSTMALYAVVVFIFCAGNPVLRGKIPREALSG